MNFFRNLSILHKQMLLMLATSTVALALGFAGFFHKESDLFRETLLRYMVIRATIIGSVSSAALDFDDPKAATEIAGALKTDPDMLSVALYSRTGAPLASFRRANEPTATFPPQLSGQGQEILPGSLAVWMPVSSSGEIVGCIYLKSDLDAFAAHRQELVLTGVGMLVVSLLAAAGLSSLLQGLISRPVLRLLETMKTVTEHKDFSQRAVKSGNDELGQLADGFNNMLQQVQSRDTELLQGRMLLEKRVHDRTADLGLEIVQRRLSELTVTESHEFLQSTLDALSYRIAILGRSGVILSVNAGWNHFTSSGKCAAAGLATGENYLEACERGWGDSAEEGPAVARGIRAVLAGEVREFTLEYPCHGPEEKRWFVVRVTRFGEEGARHIVVAHVNVTERKLAEEELRWKTAFLEAQVNSSTDGILVVDPQLRRILQNQRTADLYKIPRHIAEDEDYEKQFQWAASMAKDPEQFIKTSRHLYAHPKETSRDEIELKDGTVLDRYTSPVVGKDGKYYGRIWAFHDITERKRQEEELRRTQTFLNSVVENLPVPVFIKEAKELRFVLWNKAGEELTGISNGEMIGKCDHDFFPGPEAEKFTAVDREVLRSGKKLDIAEEQLQTRHKGIRTVRVTKVPIMDGAGQPKFILGIAEDITERKEVQKRLMEGEHRLRSILEAQPECVKLVAADGTLMDMNPAGLQMVEAGSPEDVIGKSVYSLVAPECVAMFRSLNEAIFQGESRIAEYEIIGLKGTRRWMETHACPLRDAEGKIFAQLAVTRDVTQRRHSEAELATAHRRLIGVSRQAGMAEVATGVLHNVGNVLNSVNVSATLLGDRLRKGKTGSFAKVAALVREQAGDLPGFFARDPRAAKLPDYLEQFAQHLGDEQAALLGEVENLRKNIEHINDIVAMQQSYAKVAGVTETLRPAELIADTLRMNSTSFDRHAIEVVTEIADVPPIEVDKHKVLQLLVNFLRNAKHACEDSGRADKRIVLRVGQQGDRIFFSVADNGVGIPPENLKRIFNHGFTTKKDGHGFGLHSGANAATEMGGSVSVHSDGPGLGATFTLELPITVDNGKRIANAPALTIAE